METQDYFESLLHYKGVIDNIARYSDRVVFMTYGVKSLRKIQEDVKPYARYNIAIALRAGDFKSETEFSSFIDEISSLTGANVFIVQNLRQWDRLPLE